VSGFVPGFEFWGARGEKFSNLKVSKKRSTVHRGKSVFDV
jgi:hypothetical protein